MFLCDTQRLLFILWFFINFVFQHCLSQNEAVVSSTILSLVDRYSYFNNRSEWNLIEPTIRKRYHHYDDLVQYLEDIHRNFPEITSLYSIGPSVLGRNIWVLSIGDNPLIHEPGEPEIKLVANIHGNEPIGREILLYFAHTLCRNYGKDMLVTKLLDSTQVFILPSLNPDGFETSIEGMAYGVIGRTNSHNVDLNRNFPDQFGKTRDNLVQEPETIRLMKWSKEHPFVLSASMHGGSLVASYPFDGSANGTSYYSAAPDDATFKHLALVYSQAHNRMYAGRPSCDPSGFPKGITNGNQWYSMQGGMQDWNYLYTGCMELTLELGCQKYPNAAELPKYWNENKYSLIVFVGEVHRALKGFVFDALTELPIGNAAIHVEGISFVTNTTSVYGDYWRLLPTNGTYNIWASKSGYLDSIKVAVDGSLLPFVQFTNSEQLNFTLQPDNLQMWSDSFDFGILPNRLPEFLQQTNYANFIRGLLSAESDAKKFFTVHEIATGKTLPIQVIVLSIPRHVSSYNDKFNLIQPQFDRLRITILGGLFASEITSTEMTIRLLRHLVKGINVSELDQLPLLATSQLMIIPYMDSDGIEQTLGTIQNQPTSGDERCNAPKSFNALNGDIIFQNRELQTLIANFEPHLVLVLQTTLDSYEATNKSRYPLYPIYLPTDIGRTGSTLQVFENLASVYFNATKQSSSFNKCSKSTSLTYTIKNNIHKQLIRYFVSPFNFDNQSSNLSKRHPMMIQLPVGCLANCFHLTESQLPMIWRQTLNGINDLLSAVRNLSYCGQVLIESGPLTDIGVDAPTKTIGPRHKWVASKSAQLRMQPVSYYFDDSNNSLFNESITSETWFSIPIHAQTGRYCELIPPGTYLVLAAAGPKNSTFDKAYEDVANAVSIGLDHFSGRTRYYLERVLNEITFTDPLALYDHMHKFTLPINQFTCGRMYSIGKSRQGRPIYSFEFGPGTTRFQPSHSKVGKTNKVTTHATNSDDNSDDFLFTLNNDQQQQINMSMHHFPKLLIVGNLHGHDRLTPQLLTHFIQLVCENHNYQHELNKLLHTIKVNIIAIPNPDGLFESWQKFEDKTDQFDTRDDRLDRPYCYLPKNRSKNSFDHHLFAGYTNHAGIDLWEQLIALTGSNRTIAEDWWWASSGSSQRFSEILEPENTVLINFLRDYQPNAILSFPTSSVSDIDFGLDPSETSYARRRMYESYNWLRHLGKLLTSGFYDSGYLCDYFSLPAKPYPLSHSKLHDRRRRPSDLLNRQYGDILQSNNFIKSAALALSLASMSPDLAMNELDSYQLQASRSFPAPLPILPPASLGLSLCPACMIASPNGVATVWTFFRFPSLIIGLMKHSTLTAPGSSGLVGHVKNLVGDPIPWARIHLDYMKSELSTGPSEQKGRFSVLLPPGTYRLTLRAKGYLHHSELVTIELTKSPIHQVFIMRSVGGLSSSYRLYVVTTLATLTAVFLCLLTAGLCYRFCCRARTPYASARRAVKSNTSSNAQNKSAQTKNKAVTKRSKRGSYHLITLDENVKSSNLSTNPYEECRQVMLGDEDQQKSDSDIGEDKDSDVNAVVRNTHDLASDDYFNHLRHPLYQHQMLDVVPHNSNNSNSRLLRRQIQRLTNRLQRPTLTKHSSETDLLVINYDTVITDNDRINCPTLVHPNNTKTNHNNMDNNDLEDNLVEVQLV